jgi:hypothetical protein
MATSRSIWPVMSRLTRPRNAPLRIWAPPESPFRIEYSPSLLKELQILNGGADIFGVLYGVRHANVIRLVATRGRAGLEPVGVFASRARGKVFLTEQDLERFEKAEACVAMVVSDQSGGFFVRDATGSIVTVRSYQEFSIHEPPAAVVVKKRPWQWAACLALIPLLLVFYWPHKPQLALTLRETEGQLRISWNIPSTDTLTILDGGERTYVPIAPGQSTATYARRTGDVTIGIGSAQVRFVGPKLPPTEIEKQRAGINALERKVASLRAASAAGQSRIAALERRLQ